MKPYPEEGKMRYVDASTPANNWMHHPAPF